MTYAEFVAKIGDLRSLQGKLENNGKNLKAAEDRVERAKNKVHQSINEIRSNSAPVSTQVIHELTTAHEAKQTNLERRRVLLAEGNRLRNEIQVLEDTLEQSWNHRHKIADAVTN